MPDQPLAHFRFQSPVAVTGAGAACALGTGLAACLEKLDAGISGLRPLGSSTLAYPPGLGDLPVGWIADRAVFKGRRYGAASNAAVHVAREAVAAAGWDKSETRQAWLYAGTSRGNAGERAGAWQARRPIAKFAASNTMHSEVAAAVSLQLGIHGPWQVISNGCAAGLDALGQAALAVAMGWTPRALVVAVDLPLVSPLLEDFASTGLLSTNGVNDPYGMATAGFLPGEGAAAVTLETTGTRVSWCQLLAYAANNDAYDAVALPPGGRPLAALMVAMATGGAHPVAICPHATGTSAHRVSETAALAHAFHGAARPSLHVFKPFTGHALGASGLLDTALLAGTLRHARLAGNLPEITAPDSGWRLPGVPCVLSPGDRVLKIAAGMGGHNAGVLLQCPDTRG